MTPNESLHALLQAFSDAVKKLVHDAVEAERNSVESFSKTILTVLNAPLDQDEMREQLLSAIEEWDKK